VGRPRRTRQTHVPTNLYHLLSPRPISLKLSLQSPKRSRTPPFTLRVCLLNLLHNLHHQHRLPSPDPAPRPQPSPP
jgi:hypothetical protein